MNKYGWAYYTFHIRLGSPHCFHRPAIKDKKDQQKSILKVKSNLT